MLWGCSSLLGLYLNGRLISSSCLYFDAQDGPKTQEPWLRRLNFEGSDDFWSQSRQTYWVQNFTNSETQLINGGKWRSSDYFEYLTVPKSGHFVPENYFSPSYSFLYDYINNGQKLECKDTTACSVVADRCAAMNHPECHYGLVAILLRDHGTQGTRCLPELTGPGVTFT